jgi:diaminohydroxyphosphoribosylaminopyrimidine deaminase/5-amino-6-(5-phosphoribosylamino)uracil reductase
MKDEKYMQLALKLAEKGKGKTSPNPMVGAVVVKNGRILAKGYHKRFGGPHAEAIAIRACGDLAKEATLYTTLEPCCHFGKTPPCTDLIIQSGIKKVVCATTDPNPKVSGKGIRKLKKEGIGVKVGILTKEARRLNEVHFKYMTSRLPFVTLTLTQTLDGRILYPSKIKRRNILSEIMKSKKPWMDAILYDASLLDVTSFKLFLDSSNSGKPKVILIGSWQEILRKLKDVRKDNVRNFICVPSDSEKGEMKKQNEFKIWKVKKRKNGEVNLLSLLKKAGKEGITSLLIEAETTIATLFLKQRLVDKIWYSISPEISGKGKEPFGDLGVRKISDAITLKNCEFKQSKDGLLVVGYPAAVISCQ